MSFSEHIVLNSCKKFSSDLIKFIFPAIGSTIMQASLYFFTTFLTDSISLKLVDIVSLARPGGTPNEFGTPKVAAPEPAFIKKNLHAHDNSH